MRSSVLPVARIIFCSCLGTGAEGGERARVRIADVCALKRKVSAKETVGEGENEIVAVMP